MRIEVVEVAERDEWRAERALCVRCEYRWMAVFPDGLTILECPLCGVMAGVPDDAPPPEEPA